MARAVATVLAGLCPVRAATLPTRMALHSADMVLLTTGARLAWSQRRLHRDTAHMGASWSGRAALRARGAHPAKGRRLTDLVGPLQWRR